MSNTSVRRSLTAPLERIWIDERGEDIVEYGLVLSLVSLAVLAVAVQVGLSLQAVWQGIGDTVATYAKTP